jgi:hypothetical protein
MKFNPFIPKPAKTCRSVLSHFGPGVWTAVNIETKLLPRTSKEASSLKVTFCESPQFNSLELEKKNFAMKKKLDMLILWVFF